MFAPACRDLPMKVEANKRSDIRQFRNANAFALVKKL